LLYNHQRPHQGLDLAKPAERYHASRRCFPESLPAIEYAPHDRVCKADREGNISFKNRRVRLGKPFRGEPVALRPAEEDGMFSVHFCTHLIGTVDLRAAPARGYVDIARAMPTNPPAKQQQQLDKLL
jgi:hypothetical protein